ncbi:MAG TPA: RHS repeat-associated core domain-containing protein, partial [Flavobacterium sp.]
YEQSSLLRPFELKFFSQPEGYVAYNAGIFSYIYQYKDHLGNNRLSYSDNNNDGRVTASEIKEEDNYYPFGLKHKGYNSVVNGYNPSKYKFNGKELQDELGLNLYAMDFRQYDPAIARFTSIDPIVHYRQSTYTAFNNNPIYWSDPSGLSGEHYDWDTGKYVNDKGKEVSFETALASQGLNADGSEKSNNENETSETENAGNKGKLEDIKFPNGDYEKKYPRLTKAVGQIYNYVKENKDVLYYLSYYSGYSTMEVLNQLEYGNGVTLLAEIMDTEYGETPRSGSGIKVNLKWVNGLETAKLNETIQGTSFLIIATILHEFVHYGRIKNGLDRTYEYGWGFERDAFGESVEKGNANDLYKKNGWKLKY